MRINKFVAQATGLSRRAADTTIASGRVLVNGTPPALHHQVAPDETVTLDGQPLVAPTETTTIMLNKPVGYVCSRDGQGSPTVYDLLPVELHHLKLVGRLDKDSSGLILLTNDGELANRLSHPKFEKTKQYEVQLNKPLGQPDFDQITLHGVKLDDGPSRFKLQVMAKDKTQWQVSMHEGRNRQIRRTFAALDYTVMSLHRTEFGNYKLATLTPGKYKEV